MNNKKELLEKGAKDFAERFEGVMHELYEEEASWQEKFDKKFVSNVCFWKGQYDDTHIFQEDSPSLVKDFISQEISKAKQEVIKDILKMKVHNCDTDSTIHSHSNYLEASDIINYRKSIDKMLNNKENIVNASYLSSCDIRLKKVLNSIKEKIEDEIHQCEFCDNKEIHETDFNKGLYSAIDIINKEIENL